MIGNASMNSRELVGELADELLEMCWLVGGPLEEDIGELTPFS